MAAATGARKSVSIHDYPEHLNPFREDDNHNKIKFWTIGRKLNRTNSISFSGMKDLKNSWAFRSFMKKGKKGQQPSQDNKLNNQPNGETSPVVYRRALQFSSASNAGSRSTVSSPERADRYVYGGSVTPLPRSRFQERLRSISQHEVDSLRNTYDVSTLSAQAYVYKGSVTPLPRSRFQERVRTSSHEYSLGSTTPRMARSEVSGSRLSVESTNPFDECPVPPVRASRRKKKRAPPPPPGTNNADLSVTSENLELQIVEDEGKKESQTDRNVELDVDEDMNLNIELKIVEDEDAKNKNTKSNAPNTTNITNSVDVETSVTSPVKRGEEIGLNDSSMKSLDGDVAEKADSEDDSQNAPFPKIDIVKYRRNSSLHEDDIRLRRGNLEDFHELSNKRSKSLNNHLDRSYITYDLNLNEHIATKDTNDNEHPQKLVCKVYEESRKQSIDNSISSTEKEFLEIDRVTKELERDINKLNAALVEDDFSAPGFRVSVSDMKKRFDKSDVSSPNPIPKPRRSHYGDVSPVNVNGNIPS